MFKISIFTVVLSLSAVSGLCHAAGQPLVMASEEGTPAADADAAEVLVGRWRAAEGTVVEIAKAGRTYSGVVVASPEHPGLRGKPLLRDLTYDVARACWSGRVYAVEMGEWLPAVIRLDSAKRFVLTGRRGPFTKEFTWTRS